MRRWQWLFIVAFLSFGLGGCCDLYSVVCAQPQVPRVIYQRTQQRVTFPEKAPQPGETILISIQGVQRTITSEEYVLARCLFAEALGLGADGMCAVGCVIRNRVQSGRPEFTEDGTYESTVLKHNAEGAYQFTCARPPGSRLWNNFECLDSLTPAEKEGRIKAFELACRIISGLQPDVTEGAVIYMTPEAASRQDWLKKALNKGLVSECYHDAGHVFFRYR